VGSNPNRQQATGRHWVDCLLQVFEQRCEEHALRATKPLQTLSRPEPKLPFGAPCLAYAAA
jgi:hypothetical protein